MQIEHLMLERRRAALDHLEGNDGLEGTTLNLERTVLPPLSPGKKNTPKQHSVSMTTSSHIGHHHSSNVVKGSDCVLAISDGPEALDSLPASTEDSLTDPLEKKRPDILLNETSSPEPMSPKSPKTNLRPQTRCIIRHFAPYMSCYIHPTV